MDWLGLVRRAYSSVTSIELSAGHRNFGSDRAPFGDRVMNGARTVKVAVPASPVLPVTVTV